MRFLPSIMTLCVALAGCVKAPADSLAAAPQLEKPRVIVTSDFPPLDVKAGSICDDNDPPGKCSDPDDLQSMVRFLLYTNELEVEALVAAAGTFANVANKQNILDMLDLYDQVDEQLRAHDPDYPTADHLRSITWQGMDGTIGTENFAGAKWRPIESLIGPDHDTEASDAIARILLEDDPSPVWVCVWGGPREAAQALWRIQQDHPADLARVVSKLRIYMILKQDYTADWLIETFPDLFIMISDKNYQGMFWSTGDFMTERVNEAWVSENLLENHGPLAAAYPRTGWNASAPGIWEGDTPTFLHIISGLRGINDPEHPDQGGWGGKFVQPDPEKNHWYDHPEGTQSVYKWRRQVQAEFAERADWMVDPVRP